MKIALEIMANVWLMYGLEIMAKWKLWPLSQIMHRSFGNLRNFI